MGKKFLLCAFSFMIMMLQGCFLSCQRTCDKTVQYPNPGACADEGIPKGEAGGPCIAGGDFSSDHCNGDLICVSGTCVPCGGPGEACCSSSTCPNGGGTCAANADNFNACDPTCGQPGQPCCEDSGGYPLCDVHSGVVCDKSTNTCGGGAPAPCSGDTVYDVHYLDVNNCVQVQSTYAQSYEEAVKCLGIQEAGGVLVDESLLDYHMVCADGSPNEDNQWDIWSDSDDHAVQCTQSACNCSWVKVGECTKAP